MRKVVDVDLGKMPENMSDPMPQIRVTWDGGVKEYLFSYYPDELSFTKEEFIGLTRDQALDLRHKKDVEYLRS